MKFRERRKWIHQFEDATMFVFFIDLSEMRSPRFDEPDEPYISNVRHQIEDTMNTRW
jgi:hypothetical protein